MKPVLELKGITKRFPGVMALSNVDISVNEGELIGLVGENGAGKSTMMQIVSGVYPYGSYEGDLLVHGEPMSFHSPADSEKMGIAMIYQELSMHLDMSILENLFLGCWVRKKTGQIDWKNMELDSTRLLTLVGLDLDPRMKLRKLSKIQQQMVAIARALQRNPRVLIMDEPTGCLTVCEVEKLFSVVHDLRSKGISIILITHKLDEVFENCSRIIVLRNGETIAEHNTQDVTMEKIVTQMVGKSIKAMYPKESVELGDEILRVEKISVKHPFNGDLNILEDISFTLRKGEILGVEGLVGSGRSELVNALFGKEGYVKGDIYIDSIKTKINEPIDAIKNGLALVTEDRRDDGFVGLRNVLENISLANLKRVSKFGKINHKKEHGLIKGLIDSVGIGTPTMFGKVQNLSGGNQQKVVLSKWLNTHPKVMILDEPTRGIDVGAKSEIYKIMVQLAKEGLGIIMISSERSELLAMCDRLIVIGKGKQQGELMRNEFNEDRILNMAMGLKNDCD